MATKLEAPITTYSEALEYISTQLPRSDEVIFRGGIGFRRAQAFFKSLGDPQNKLRVIHMAGTSGKGTTASLISSILAQHGYKVGMTLSPYVYDIRERIQLNNELISRDVFTRYLELLRPQIEKFKQTYNEVPSYFEVLIALAMKIFVGEGVEYAVIETGLGGTNDATNTTSRADKVCVLGRIGFDHVGILGHTLPAIASQKAGIIHTHNRVLALQQSPTVNRIFKDTAARKIAELNFITSEDAEVSIAELRKLNPQLWGDFNRGNVALAIATTKYLAKRDGWKFSTTKLKPAIKQLYIPGRFEILQCREKTFILDGAHNQQKLDALFQAVASKYPNQQIGVIVAMRSSKQVPKLTAAKVLAASFTDTTQDMPSDAFSPMKLATELKGRNRSLQIKIASDVETAVEKAFESPLQLWVVTGSFFILKPVRDILK